MKITKSIQRPAQTKEQTKMIAQGVQQSIDLYKHGLLIAMIFFKLPIDSLGVTACVHKQIAK